MQSILEHPVIGRKREVFAPMTDEDKLKLCLDHLKYLDPTAVYIERGDSTIVYYVSPHAEHPPGHVCRIVLDPQGKHRRIDSVGFDPR